MANLNIENLGGGASAMDFPGAAPVGPASEAVAAREMAKQGMQTTQVEGGHTFASILQNSVQKVN